jgi:hypothetical protein
MNPTSWWHLAAEKTFYCVVLYALGQMVHILVVKIPSLRKQAAANNAPFTGRMFWSTEWDKVVLAALLPVIGLIVMSAMYQQGWVKTFLPAAEITFLFGGFSGSSLILSKFGKMNPFLNSVADKQTNLLQEIAPGTANVAAAQAKADLNVKGTGDTTGIANPQKS